MESDTAARLRKNHTEMGKSMNQLESHNRELLEKSRVADDVKLQLEKELLQLQAALDSEKRNYSQGSEEIRELQGKAAVQLDEGRLAAILELKPPGASSTSIYLRAGSL